MFFIGLIYLKYGPFLARREKDPFRLHFCQARQGGKYAFFFVDYFGDNIVENIGEHIFDLMAVRTEIFYKYVGIIYLWVRQ